jgi:hypothetical protein
MLTAMAQETMTTSHGTLGEVPNETARRPNRNPKNPTNPQDIVKGSVFNHGLFQFMFQTRT